MGNCSQKSSLSSTSKPQNSIRITTDGGRLIELQGPKIAREVLDDFPGYGIYQRGQLSLPLFEDEVLCNGRVYYLLPFGVSNGNVASAEVAYSGSLSFRKNQSSCMEVLPSSGDGVWRVKMAIDSRELEEMLSENAEALIQMMRSAARSSVVKSPGRHFGWRSIGLIPNGFKIPASGKLTTCRYGG